MQFPSKLDLIGNKNSLFSTSWLLLLWKFTQLTFFFNQSANIFMSRLHRVGPPSPVCWCEPRFPVMGAQQTPPVHPLSILALQGAAELHPAGQRRLPAWKTLHGPRWELKKGNWYSQVLLLDSASRLVVILSFWKGSMVHPNPNFPLVPHVRHPVNLNFIQQKK